MSACTMRAVAVPRAAGPLGGRSVPSQAVRMTSVVGLPALAPSCIRRAPPRRQVAVMAKANSTLPSNFSTISGIGGVVGETGTTKGETRMISVSPAAVAALPLASMYLGDLAAGGLQSSVQLLYLGGLLTLLGGGGYLVVRQVLIRRELDSAAKGLGDKVRAGDANSEELFEYGVVMLRKKVFTQAIKYLEDALRTWEGEEEELAQLHNALGFAYFNQGKVDAAIKQYNKAVKLQPGYLTAWNNLGDAQEKAKNSKEAYVAYKEVLALDPNNAIAMNRAAVLKERLDRLAPLTKPKP